MKKRVLALLLAVLLCAGLFAGCADAPQGESKNPTDESEASQASQGEANPTEEFVTLRILMPGDPSARMNDFMKNELNAKLKEELNCNIELVYSPWSDYWNTVNMELGAGQPYDLFWDASTYFSTRVSQQAYTELNDLLDQYGPALKEKIAQAQFDAYTIDGKLYALPMNEDPAGMYRSVCVRQDILEEVGMTTIETKEDLFEYLEKGKAAHPEMDGVAGSLAWILSKYGLADHTITQLGTNDIAFVIEEEEEPTVHSWFESEEFKTNCEIMNDLYQKGLEPDWVLTNLGDAYTKFSAGQLLMYRGTGGTTALNEQIIKQGSGNPDATLREYKLYPDKPDYFTTASNNLLVIPAASENPERAMMFVNWMVESQENYDFMVYGVEGTDYTLEGDRVNRTVTDEFFPGWMLLNSMGRYTTADSEEGIKTVQNWNEGAKYSKAFGFIFDESPVAAEKAKIDAVVQEVFSPMLAGIIPYEGNYESAIAQLKDAGLDAYLAELQNQFTEFASK